MNFTLRGSAFNDTDGDGVPDGVIREVDNLNGEIKLDGQPPVIIDENQIDTDAPKISNEQTNSSLLPTIELFAMNNEIITPQEKNRSDITAASNYDASDFNEVLNTRFEEILPEKNICADFVLNSEFKFNATLADSSTCRKQEPIDFEREIQGSEMNRQ